MTIEEEVQSLKKEFAYLRTKVMNADKFALTTGVESSNNDSQFPVFQVEYMGKTADVFIVFPYGMYASLPEGQLLVVQSIGAEEANRAALGSGNPKDRPEIESGEVIYFHPDTGATIHLKNNGEIDIEAPNGKINLGSGGKDIARLGDEVKVTIIGGSSAGVHTGSITKAGNNTST